MITPISASNISPFNYRSQKLNFKSETSSQSDLGKEQLISANNEQLKQFLIAGVLAPLVILPVAAITALMTKKDVNINKIFSKSELFRTLNDDKSIPTLETCKSINNDLRKLLEIQVNFNKTGKSSSQALDFQEAPKITNRLLLHGPAGSGKSFFAKIYAKSLGAEYTEILFSDVNSRWAGEVEESLKNTFETIIKTAQKNSDKKYVVTFNEIDAVITSPEGIAYNGGSHWVSILRERSVILNYIEILNEKAPNVVIIGTTNLSPAGGQLDKAVISRFQNLIEVPYPDKTCLYEALKANLSNLKDKDKFFINNDTELQYLAEKMSKRKFSFRNLEHVIQEAKNMYLNDALKDNKKRFDINYLLESEKSLKLSDGEIDTGTAAKSGIVK